MDKKIAYCGIICDGCPVYKATIDNDDELRKNTAKLLKEKFNIDIRPEQVNCMGCRSEAPIAFTQSCAIKACNLEKHLDNCGECNRFPCDKVTFILDSVPGAKERLEACRK
jgi:hypothetical protein